MNSTEIILKLVNTVAPPFEETRKDIADFKKANRGLSAKQLANAYGDSICWKYASVGAASALPGVIPGLGTATQIAVEGASISADLAIMLRWMASMTCGVGLICGRDIESSFNQEFVKTLGLWCGVLTPAKEATLRIASKVAVARFKSVPGKVFQKINQRVGTTILTKYGTKRGGIAVGRLIPFGIGALVGGGFNLATMKGFKVAAIRHFRMKDDTVLVMEVDS